MDDPLSTLPPLRDIIHEHGLRAEKSLGQNFILDQNLTDKIVRVAGSISPLHVFEIGPGPGGLTRSILRANPAHLTAIEFDSRAIKALESLATISAGRLSLREEDALRADLTQIDPKTDRAIIANLPYNIATPLLINWLQQVRSDAGSLMHMTLMFQKEVAERIVAKPNQSAYGRLAVITQWLCEASISFDVPPSAFVPPPKVTSSIVFLKPKKLIGEQPEFATVERLTAMAFNQRRKMIRSSLKPYLPLIKELEIEETLRAENLGGEDYIRLAKLVEKQ